MRLLPCWKENNVCDADDFIKEVGSGSDYGFDFEDEISHSSDIFYPLEGYLSRIPTNFIPTLHRQTLSSR